METRLIDVSKCLFVLTYEDAQFAAKDLIGRDLTEEELRDVKKRNGMGAWRLARSNAFCNPECC